MISWNTNKDGRIDMVEVQPSNAATMILAPFSPVSAAIAGLANIPDSPIYKRAVITDNGLETYLPQGVAKQAQPTFQPNGYVSEAHFTIEGTTISASFNDVGKVVHGNDNLEKAQESQRLERISITATLNGAPGESVKHHFDVDWLVWITAQSHLKIAIRQGCVDTDKIIDAVTSVCDNFIFFGGISDINYAESGSVEYYQEMEAGFIAREIEGKAQRAAGAKTVTHPRTVRTSMELFGLTDDDLSAYIASRGLELLPLDTNRVVLVDTGLVKTVIGEAYNVELSDDELTAIATEVAEHYKRINFRVTERITDVYESISQNSATT